MWQNMARLLPDGSIVTVGPAFLKSDNIELRRVAGEPSAYLRKSSVAVGRDVLQAPAIECQNAYRSRHSRWRRRLPQYLTHSTGLCGRVLGFAITKELMEHEDVAVKYGTLSDKNLGDDITPALAEA